MRSAARRDRPSFNAVTAASTGRIELALSVVGAETEEAKNAKVILADTRLRVTDETHAALAQIVEPADRIIDRSVFVAVERIDRKVAAFRVLFPRCRERDDGMAAIGFDIATQRRDFKETPSVTTVIVPWSIPVGYAPSPASARQTA